MVYLLLIFLLLNTIICLMKILINQIRKEKNMTLNALSSLSGVSTRLIQNYNKGDVDPTLSKLIKIAKALNVSVVDLYAE